MSKPSTYRRRAFARVLARVKERRRFIQVLAGPRQSGKTTLARQVVEAADIPAHVASADDPTLRERSWIEEQWNIGRARAREEHRALLVLDEVQKVTAWSETVKRLWDEDTRSGVELRVLLLGSAPLLVQRGLTESLAGRFEIVRVGHWTLAEMREAFGWTLDQFLFFGGYPAAVSLIEDRERWARYILDALIETTISRDVLLLTRVDKPALLRQLFRLACEYSGQVVAYQKLVGQLQDAGNTTTLAHYIELLAGAGLVVGLAKYSGSHVRQRGSSPKLVALNNGLVAATAGLTYPGALRDPVIRGRLVETAVGAHLLATDDPHVEVYYWRDRNREVDYVVRAGRALVAIEVKSGQRKTTLPGLADFAERYRGVRQLVVGAQGIDVEEFLEKDAALWLR